MLHVTSLKVALDKEGSRAEKMRTEDAVGRNWSKEILRYNRFTHFQSQFFSFSTGPIRLQQGEVCSLK